MKVCNQCEKYPVFSKGQCRSCWGRNYSKPIKKQSVKQSAVKSDDLTFYRLAWDSAENHNCEECDRYLGNEMRPHFISHILSKGAFPEHRYNELNYNILCLSCHNKWEFGDKSSMRIYPANLKVIEYLKTISCS